MVLTEKCTMALCSAVLRGARTCVMVWCCEGYCDSYVIYYTIVWLGCAIARSTFLVLVHDGDVV